MRNIFLQLFVSCIATMLVQSSFAATIDLNGGTVAAADLTATYGNTAEATATLVFDVAEDVSFSGTVGGNILVVKKGGGKLTLATDNTHTGCMIISNGFISVDAESRLGTGTVTFAGGGIEVTKDITQTSVVFDFRNGRHGTVHVSKGVTFNIANNFFLTDNGSFTKTGEGTLGLGSQFMSTVNARWIIDEGSIYASVGNIWGGHASNPTITLELNEDAILHTAAHMPLTHLIMRGGLVYHRKYPLTVSSFEKWSCFSIKQSISVLPSKNGKPSRILADHCYSGHANMIPMFDVREGAELRVETMLERGYDSSGVEHVGGGFVKTGKGVMTLCQPCDFDGGNVLVEDGVLRLERAASISPNTKLTLAPDACIELEDGAAMDCVVLGRPKVLADAEKVLSDADVRLDASTYLAVNGQIVESIQNKGKVGGAFGRIVVAKNGATTIPSAPVWRSTAINSRPALYFDGNAMLMLDRYTNKTVNVTMCAVGRRATFKNYGGYVSMKEDNAKRDEQSTGRLHIEDKAGIRVFSRNNNKKAEVVSLSLSGVAADDTPFFDFYESSDVSRFASQYANGTTVSCNSSVVMDNPQNFNIELVGVGGRWDANRAAQYAGPGSTSNRMFDGYIGELLVWSRILTDEEKAEVSAYLKNKWFGIEPEDDLDTSRQQVSIGVPEGCGAVKAVAGDLTKDGGGALAAGDVSKAKRVRVEEGTLALLPTSFVHKVSVWVDAADASTLTVEDGKVTAVRNKGSCGGVFTRNTLSGEVSPGVPEQRTDINGLSTIYFDGNSALALQNSYKNVNADRRIQIFMVGCRSKDSDLSRDTKGRFGGAFCIASTKLDLQDHQQTTAPHVEEVETDGLLSVRFFLGVGKYAKIDDASFYDSETPFLLATSSGLTGMSFLMEMQDGVGDAALLRTSSSLDTSALDLDIIQIGGRLGKFGTAQWYGQGVSTNRMWLGSVGEFIVCDVLLTREEQEALQTYLRAKWFNSNKDAEKPNVLGPVLAPTFNAEGELALAEGTTLESHAPTVSIGSLMVEGAATLVRGSVTDPAQYALFNAVGDVSLPSKMTIQVLTRPEAYPASLIVTGVGKVSGVTEWTVDGRSGLFVDSGKDGIRLLSRGLVMTIR